jgi:cyclopropane fatty-acyl-phospholipid synthase-like methyltransferase
MEPPTHNATVRDGYDQVAELYADERRQQKVHPRLTELLARIGPGGRVLDVGCGAGVPISSLIDEMGIGVIGVDISPRQIELARTNVPDGEFMVRDMLDLKQGEFEVDAVFSFYAVFHTPRESHAPILSVFASFLSEGGLLLVTMGADEWEGREDFFGAPMWWSHYGAKKNRQIVESSGFDVISDEIDPSGGERHQVIFARKR